MASSQVRIFVSSPGDVGPEREVAARVIGRLRSQYAGVLDVEGIFWEHEPLRATESFQPQIPTPDQSDIYVCILWSRLGTRLPPEVTGDLGEKTGTEYEFELAHESFKDHNQPDFLVYIKQTKLVAELGDEEAILERLRQKKLLDAFVRRWFFGADGTLIAAHHQFEDAGRFEELLEQHLRTLLKQRAPQVSGGEGSPEPWWTQGSPFRGLRYFDFEHAPVFFGRTRAIGHVLDFVRRQMAAKRAFVLVLGMSGCGKSSLVRAGVLSYLVLPGVIEGVGLWRRAVMRPSDAGIDLFRALAQALLREEALPELSADGTKAEELAAMLKDNPTGADPLIKGALSQAAFAVQQAEGLEDQPQARLVLVVDQLEEIWTLEGITAGARADFVRTLASLSRSGRVAVVATLRSDFYHRCEELPELVELKEGASEYQLKPPTPAEIGQMVRLPALAVGLRYEVEVETGARLDDVLRDTAARSPEALPLLEFALDELYEIGKVDGLLSFAEYEQIGCLEGAIARRAERSFEAFVEGQKLHGAEAERLLGALFQSLVTVGQESDSVTRRYAALDTLRESSDLLSALIDAFVDARLLTAGRTEDGLNTLSVAHETLLERWARLRDWIAWNRELLIIRQRVADAAARWEATDRPHDLLLAQGLPLAEAEAFIQRSDALVHPAVSEYVQRSAAHWQRIGKRRRRIATTAIVVIGLLLVVVAAISLYAYRQAEGAARIAIEATEQARQDAKRIAEERDHAKEQRERADSEREEARRQLYNSSMLQVGVHLGRDNYVLAGVSLWQAPIEFSGWEWGFAVQRIEPSLLVFERHDEVIWSAAFSPDGRYILTSSNDNTARVWDVETGRTVHVLEGHEGSVRSAAFSPDGARILTTSWDRTARVWDLETGVSPQVFEGHEDEVWSAVFSADGRRILTASGDNTARVWDLETGRTMHVLEGHKGFVRSAAFSPDGARILTASWDRTARVWDAETGTTLYVLEGHEGEVNSAAFSPDGRRILTASSDHTARVWDADTGTTLRVLEGHEGGVSSAAFSPDGRRILTASRDRTARVWDADTGMTLHLLQQPEHSIYCAAFSPDGRRILAWGHPAAWVWDTETGVTLQVLEGHMDSVSCAVFSPNGHSIFTASFDLTGRVWDADTCAAVKVLQMRKGTENLVGSAAFSPDGRHIVTASGENPAQVWDAETGMALHVLVLEGHKGWEDSAAFSPDGRRILAWGGPAAWVWDAETGVTVQLLEGHAGPVLSAAYSPDGVRVVTTSRDRTARVWDAETGAALHVLEGHEDQVNSAAFRPDGRYILTSSNDNTARVWEAETGVAVQLLEGHAGSVLSAAFSPDGARIVTTSRDRTARLWDAETGAALYVLEGHEYEVNSAAFSPDGARIVTTSRDRTARVWDAETGAALHVLEGHEREVNSAAFSPDGRRIVTASSDHTARVWEAETGVALQVLEGHEDQVRSATFSPDGTRILTTSDDYTVRIWTAAPWRLGDLPPVAGEFATPEEERKARFFEWKRQQYEAWVAEHVTKMKSR